MRLLFWHICLLVVFSTYSSNALIGPDFGPPPGPRTNTDFFLYGTYDYTVYDGFSTNPNSSSLGSSWAPYFNAQVVTNVDAYLHVVNEVITNAFPTDFYQFKQNSPSNTYVTLIDSNSVNYSFNYNFTNIANLKNWLTYEVNIESFLYEVTRSNKLDAIRALLMSDDYVPKITNSGIALIQKRLNNERKSYQYGATNLNTWLGKINSSQLPFGDIVNDEFNEQSAAIKVLDQRMSHLQHPKISTNVTYLNIEKNGNILIKQTNYYRQSFLRFTDYGPISNASTSYLINRRFTRSYGGSQSYQTLSSSSFVNHYLWSPTGSVSTSHRTWRNITPSDTITQSVTPERGNYENNVDIKIYFNIAVPRTGSGM